MTAAGFFLAIGHFGRPAGFPFQQVPHEKILPPPLGKTIISKSRSALISAFTTCMVESESTLRSSSPTVSFLGYVGVAPAHLISRC